MAKNPTISDTMAEAGIIATLIYNPTYCLHSEQLKHTHFYNEESAYIYWGISQLIKQGVENIDSFNLTAVINSNEGIKNSFDKYNINLEEYMELSKQIVRNSIEEYKLLINRVLALAFKRDLHKQLKRFDGMCLDVDQDDIGQLSGEVYSTINKLNEQYIIGKEEVKSLGEIIDDLWEEIKLDSTKEVNNFKPKIESLQEYFDYSAGSLTLFVARYKAGKSAIALNESLNLANKGAVIGYFDSELSTKEFTIRCLANLAQIPVRRIKNGQYSPSEETILRDALVWLKSKKIIHIYDPVWTNDKIITMSKILKLKYGMNFLVFDYIKYTSGLNASDTYLRLGNITDTLKNNVGGELNIPVLALAQLNRQGEIADSDNIARYVSTVIYWKKKKVDEFNDSNWKKVGNYTAQVRVNRAGGQMADDEYVHCVFDGDRMTVFQAPQQPKDDEIGL